jgi:glycosyltransferase involved in cell wall biosynthesis
MKASIVICFYERIDFLEKCLDSLRSSAGDIHEVVIADDGSSDAAVDRVRELATSYPFPVVHAWHERQGPRRSATRNDGVRAATGDYIIFLDADFAALPGAIRSHLEAAKPGYFAAGRCKYTTEEQCKRILESAASDQLLETIYGELADEPIEKEHRRFVRYTWLYRFGLSSARRITFGGHFSAFKKDIEAVNGYDENYVGWGGEDIDFALRMVLSGCRGTSVIRSARILHLWHPREMGNKHWKEGANVGYLFRKKIKVFCENGLVRISDSNRANVNS